MISFHGIAKRYGELEVLKGIDFEVVPGSITAEIGRAHV